MKANYSNEDIKLYFKEKTLKTTYYSKIMFYRIIDVDFSKNATNKFILNNESISYKDYIERRYNQVVNIEATN